MADQPPNPDAELIARLLWGENANNLSEEEALHIGDSVLNRVASPHYPDTVADVVLQPRQYSPFNPEDPNYRRIQEFGPKHPKWQQYMGYALNILNPMRPRTSVTHYFAQKPPMWADSMQGLRQIGAHWFGTEDPKSRQRRSLVKVASTKSFKQ